MDILDLIFPKECLGCGRAGCYFCKNCEAKMAKAYQACPVCEKPSLTGQTHTLCQNSKSLSGLYCFFNYEGILKKTIHKIKYEFVTDIFTELFSAIFRNWQDEENLISLNKFIDQKKPILVPIPLHWHKENIRGFNQSVLFGKALAKRLNLSLREDILEKKKPTVSQTTLGPRERKENVKGIFKLKRQIKGQNIILVDDVWTTGATMKEATKVLKEAGAKKVWGLTICR